MSLRGSEAIWMSTNVLFYKDRFVAPLLAMTCFSTFIYYRGIFSAS